jgi:hypothetical protein
MSNGEIKILKTIAEFQQAINQVKATRKPLKISHEYDISEEEMAGLDMSGVDVVNSEEYDEIVPV